MGVGGGSRQQTVVDRSEAQVIREESILFIKQIAIERSRLEGELARKLEVVIGKGITTDLW